MAEFLKNSILLSNKYLHSESLVYNSSLEAQAEFLISKITGGPLSIYNNCHMTQSRWIF